MERRTFRVLALDLEGTIVSDADGAFPRPGLYDFLQWCADAFERVVLFTCVSEPRVRAIVRQLVTDRAVPAWFETVECVAWEGRYKDVRFVPNTTPDEVLLVDDKKFFVRPDQENQWVPIARYLPPFPDDDSELETVRTHLARRLA